MASSDERTSALLDNHWFLTWAKNAPKWLAQKAIQNGIYSVCVYYIHILCTIDSIYILHNDRKSLTLISIPACGCLQPSDTATWQFGFVRKVAWSWQPRNWDDVDIDIDIDIDICICTCICLYCMCNMLEKLFYQFGNSWNSYLQYYIMSQNWGTTNSVMCRKHPTFGVQYLWYIPYPHVFVRKYACNYPNVWQFVDCIIMCV